MKRVNIRSVKQATGELVELYLESGLTAGRLLCAQNLIPRPGQYLLAHDGSPARSSPPAQAGWADSPLPAPIFNGGVVPGGFLLAPPIPAQWRPGIAVTLRGPLGRGFSVPASARCVALVALGETAARLKPLLAIALGQGASVVLVSDLELPGLPPEVEIQPVAVLAEVSKWADYMALDLPRELMPGMREKLGFGGVEFEAQALVITPLPCGGVAECGVCAVNLHRGWKLACKDGPVFDLKAII